ncbi:MAG: hypothetical protein Q4G51_16335 [Dermatophilus congolensis]|nr:hypothetical protein [Dermatophilus congolensis]
MSEHTGESSAAHGQPQMPEALATGFRNFHAGCCGFVATRADGSEWPFMMTLHDGSTMHGLTPGVLLAEMIAGYAEADESRRAELRAADALTHATRAQELEVERARHSGRIDPADPDDAAVLAILGLPKTEALWLAITDEHVSDTNGAEPEQAPWHGAVPLVLVATAYAPHSDTPRIGGNVRWLDPSDEVAYLRSLREVGLYDIWIDPDA